MHAAIPHQKKDQIYCSAYFKQTNKQKVHVKQGNINASTNTEPFILAGLCEG